MTYCMVELRKKKNITQLELAKSIGVSKGAIGMWETGKRVPSLSKAILIGKFFNVPVEEIKFEKKGNEHIEIEKI